MKRTDGFEELEVWQEARRLVRTTYAMTGGEGFRRDRALREQMRRASVSVMSNIAEGFERDSDREFARFLAIAKGSCGELRCQLYIALDLGCLEESCFREMRNQALVLSRRLAKLRQYLRESDSRNHR